MNTVQKENLRCVGEGNFLEESLDLLERRCVENKIHRRFLLYAIFDNPPVSTLIKIRKLERAGKRTTHGDGQIPKVVLFVLVEWRLPLSKSQKRWVDLNDIYSKEVLNIRKWKTVSRNLRVERNHQGGKDSTYVVTP